MPNEPTKRLNTAVDRLRSLLPYTDLLTTTDAEVFMEALADEVERLQKQVACFTEKCGGCGEEGE